MNKKQFFFRVIPPSQENVLLALGRYKFLTTGQLLKLGIMSDRSNLNKQIAELRSWRNPLVHSITFGISVFWKLQSIHHLTSHGAELIEEHFGLEIPARFPKRNVIDFHQDYFHRVSTVDFQILLYERTKKQDMELLFFKTYFDKLATGKKNGFRAASAIPMPNQQYLVADALCMLQTPKRKELYAVEIYRKEDTNRIHKSLLQHLMALVQGQPSTMFDLNHGSRILCVFETESSKLNAMKRICEDKRFANAKKHFLFGVWEELKNNVFENWLLFDEEKTNLF